MSTEHKDSLTENGDTTVEGGSDQSTAMSAADIYAATQLALANDFIDQSRVFEGLRDEGPRAALLDALQRFTDSRDGRVLFNVHEPDDCMARAHGILIPEDIVTIAIANPDRTIVTGSTLLPGDIAMGSKGFLGEARSTQVTSHTDGANFWRLMGPLKQLGLERQKALLLRANLLALRGEELESLNSNIGKTRAQVTPTPELPGLMAPILEHLSAHVDEVTENTLPQFKGHFYYLESGKLKVEDERGRSLGMVTGPAIVQELIGAGRDAETASLKPIGVVRGAHVPCRALIEMNALDHAEALLNLLEASIEEKFTVSNEAVTHDRTEGLSGWAKALEGFTRWIDSRKSSSV